MGFPTLAQPPVNSTTISGSTAFGTLGSNTTTGNTILVFSYFSGSPLATVSSVAVNAGSATFLKILAVPGIAGSIPSLEVWAAPNITGGTSPRVTATYSSAPGANAADLVIFELSAIPINLTPDGIPAGIGNSTAATAMTAPVINTTQNGDIIFAAFATASTVTAGEASWTNTVSQHLGCSVQYLQVSNVQTGLTPTSTQTSSLAYGALTLGLASSTAAPVPPAQASALGLTTLVFDEEFVTSPDIGFATDGHKWNAGLFYQTTPPSSCFTNALSVETITAQIPETTTSASFAIPAQNTAVQVSLNAGYSPTVGDLVFITDGTNNLAADVTIISPFTVNTRVYPGNPTSGTMASGAAVSLCNNVNLCTTQQDGLGGINFVGGYYEALINLTDFGAFWLFNAANKEGTPGLSGNPFTWNNEIDIIEGDPGASFLNNATTTIHKSTNSVGTGDQQNSNNNNTTSTPVMAVWNKFGMLWTKTNVTWYFNDVQICTAAAYTSTWKYATLILNASKNGVNGSPSTVIPPNIQVDWVRVWQKAPVDLGATISVVQTAKNQVATSSCAVAYGSNVTKGNALIVFTYTSLNGSPSVTDSLNNNYYTIPLQGTDNTVTHRFNCFYCNGAASGANTITVAAASATYINVIVYEVNFGNSTIAFLDQAFGVTNQSGTSMTSGTTFLTSIAHEIVFGFFGATSVITAGQAGFTSTISTDGLAMAQYKLLTSTGTQSTTGTQTSASAYMGGTVSFLALSNPSMAISVVQFPTMVTGTNTQTPAQTFAGAVAAGDTIFAFVSWDGSSGSVTQVVDSVNGSTLYTAVGPIFQGSAESFQLWYLPNSLAGTPTVTATLDAIHNNASVDCLEVSGLTSSPLIDARTAFNGVSGTALTSGTIQTTYPIELLIGGCRGNGTTIQSGGNGWTTQMNNRTGFQYFITSSAGIYSSNFTQSASAGYIDGIWAITFPGQTPVVTAVAVSPWYLWIT